MSKFRDDFKEAGVWTRVRALMLRVWGPGNPNSLFQRDEAFTVAPIVQIPNVRPPLLQA